MCVCDVCGDWMSRYTIRVWLVEQQYLFRPQKGHSEIEVILKEERKSNLRVT